MLPALGSAVSGLRDAGLRLDVTANNIANVDTPDFGPSRVLSAEAPGGGVSTTVAAPSPRLGVPGEVPAATDLATELANLMVARIAFAASLRVIRTAASLERAALDVLA
jgi:flagellar hook protein FlgE